MEAYKDKNSLEYYINNGWDTHMGDPEPMWKKHITKKKIGRQFVFITLQDFQTRMKDLEDMKEFVNDISCLYECGHWVIETGGKENEKDFNIHVHLLVKIAKHVKNHKRDLNIAWERHRDTTLYDKDYYQMKQFRISKKMPSYETWLQEKLDYFDNTKKTKEHQNTVDLGLCGTY